MSPDDALRELATLQGGAFTRADALRVGFTPAAVRHRLRVGRWTAPVRGVYVESTDGAPATVLAKCAALTLAWQGAVVSHDTAAALHELPVRPLLPERLHITRPGGRPQTPDYDGDVVVHSAAHVDPTTFLCGVVVTSAARTIVDVTRQRGALDGLIAADHAARSGLVDPAELLAVVRTQRRWPHIGRARLVAELASPLSESAGESFSRLFFAQQKLVMPEQQAVIRHPDGQVARVDFLWRDRHVIGEFDGMIKYGDPAALRAEKVRQEWLEELGYRVVRWTWMQLLRESMATERRIRRALALGGTPNLY